MSEIQYKLTHYACQETFYPQQLYRLHCEASFQKDYKFQDLMVGVCPKCKVDVFGWIAIDYAGDPRKYFFISAKKHTLWIDRMDSSLLAKLTTSLHNVVTGSQLDKQSGRFIFRNNIPVY